MGLSTMVFGMMENLSKVSVIIRTEKHMMENGSTGSLKVKVLNHGQMEENMTVCGNKENLLAKVERYTLMVV